MINGTSSIFKGLNYSDEERGFILADIQHQMTIILLPSILFLCLVFIIGVIGNPLVIFVYSRRFSISPLRTYVKMAAVYDLLANLIIIPGDISDIFNWWDYNQPYLCKARRFANSTISMSSALLLLALAVARYIKVCRPFSTQVNMTHVKISMVFVIGLPLVFSAGYGVLNGRQSKMTRHPGVKGYFCSIDDSFVKTKWPMIHACFLLLLFLSCCIPLVVLYALIGAKTWRHQRSLMAATRFNISDQMGIIKTNKMKAAERGAHSTSKDLDTGDLATCNLTSRDLDTGDLATCDLTSKHLDTGDLATCDLTKRMKACNFKCSLLDNDVTSNETDGAEGQGPRTIEELRVLTTGKLQKEFSTFCCKYDEDNLVTGNNMTLERVKVGALGRYFYDCEELQIQSEIHKPDIINAETRKDEITNSGIHKSKITNSGIHKSKINNSGIHKSKINNSGIHKSRINKSERHKEDVIGLEVHKRDIFMSTVEDRMREDLSTFQPNEILSPHIRASTSIKLLPTMLRPHSGLLTSSNATLSDGGASLLAETPSDSLQRHQSLGLDFRLPRKGEHSGSSKQLHTAREKGVHTSRSFDRTTRMLLAMTLIFIFTYLPFVCLELFKHAALGAFASLNDTLLSMYYLFWRSYLLNSCANPIIYCLYDLKFRRESLKTVLKLLPFKKQTNNGK